MIETDDSEHLPDTGYGETSRYVAHLDRGWSLFDRNELNAARQSAYHAQSLRPEAPDATVLLGAIALAEGDPLESRRFYDIAIDLDPDYIEPYIVAAQISLFDLDEPERALKYCDNVGQSEDLHELDAFDIELLAIESLLLLRREQDAIERLDRLDVEVLTLLIEGATSSPDGEAEEPLDEEDQQLLRTRIIQLSLRTSRLAMDLQRPQVALHILSSLVAHNPSYSDAWHLLAESELLNNDSRAACQAALRVYRLDAEHILPEWLPSAAKLHRQVVQILHQCPEPAFRQLIERDASLVILVHEAPALEHVLEGVDPRTPVLALTIKSLDGEADEKTSLHLTGLAIYRRNLSRLSPEHFDEEFQLLIFDELASVFHLEQEQRSALGLPPLAIVPSDIVPPKSEESSSRSNKAKKLPENHTEKARKRKKSLS